MKALECYFQHDGKSWHDFEIIQSNKSYEVYGPKVCEEFEYSAFTQANNNTYAWGSDSEKSDDMLIGSMLRTFRALKIKAASTKLEGCEIGQGKLIIQSRMPITIEDDNDFSEGPRRRKITWRGNMLRIGADYELQ